MSGLTVNYDAAEYESPDHELDFKTRSLIGNDRHLSVIYFFVTLLIPFLVWGMADDRVIFIWQGVMVFILVSRWVCGYMCSMIEADSDHKFWTSATILLTLLGGLGWGTAGVLFFPAESHLQMSLAALILITMGGVGAMSYSARPMIAIPYHLCVVSPYAIRLYFGGGDYEFILASYLSVLSMLFCFATERLQQTLNTALAMDNNDEEVILVLEEQNLRLYNTLGKEISRRRELQKERDSLADEIDELKEALDKQIHPYGVEPEHGSRVETVGLPTLKNQQATVLLVHNDQNERQIIEAFLRAEGLSYESVQNVPEALAILCECSDQGKYFDLVIANRWMPDMDGLSFAECLNDDPEYHILPFALINAGQTVPRSILEKSGVNMVITPPVLPRHISEAIGKLIYQHTSELIPLPETSVVYTRGIAVEVNDAIQLARHSTDRENDAGNVIDQYVIDGLLSSAPDSFVKIVDRFLEDIPSLIDAALTAYAQRDSLCVKRAIREVGSRSLHMGANRLVSLTKTIEEMLGRNDLEKAYAQLQFIEAEFIQVESELLANLTHSVFHTDQSKH